MTENDVERAERLGSARALVMAIAAIVLLINTAIQYGNPNYTGSDARGASWLVVIGLWTFILWNGGGFRPTGRTRALMNDELSLQNRGRALALGFYASTGTALVLFVVNWSSPISTGDALKIVSAAGLAAALGRYAWLEWRWR
jgi:hypothetical protein